MQRLSLILWKKAENEVKEFDIIAKEAYGTLSILQKYPEQLRPNFLTSWHKSKAVRVEWNFENFYDWLKSGIVNKIGKKTSPDLGYSLSFFSSMNEAESSGISISVGNTCSKFVNTFILNFPLNLAFDNIQTSSMISEIFIDLVSEFNPFWGCIENSEFTAFDEGYLKNGMPTFLHWMNYWSDEILSNVDRKFLEMIQQEPKASLSNGVLRLRDKVLNCKDEEDLQYFKVLNSYYDTLSKRY